MATKKPAVAQGEKPEVSKDAVVRSKRLTPVGKAPHPPSSFTPAQGLAAVKKVFKDRQKTRR